VAAAKPWLGAERLGREARVTGRWRTPSAPRATSPHGAGASSAALSAVGAHPRRRSDL